MKKTFQALLLAIMIAGVFAFNNANALQVTVSGATTGNGTYATLSDAFNAVNVAQTASDNILITISGNTTEPAGGAILGNQNWNSVTIQPDGLGQWTISGAATAGLPLIDLNGADKVTINGLDATNGNMIISNTTASSTSGTSTIRMQADATNNTVTNCTVLGSFSAAVATNGGNIYFGAGAVSTGNDNNTISNCNIGPAGANLPTKGVYGNGSTTNSTLYNSGNTITGCNIYDYFGAAVTSAGIYLGGGNTDYTITNNKFYQTASRTQTTGSVHAGIYMASANIANNSITGNTIGYASNTGTGTYTFVGVSSSSRFVPIFLSTIGASPVSNVQGNTITAISVSGFVSGTSTSSPFIGIYVGTGIANIGDITGNTIGSQTVAGSISYTSSGTSAAELYGIYYFPSSVCIISNNKVGGISGTNSSTGGFSIYGIRAFTSSSVTNTMQNNTIGYSAAPIESNATGSTASRVVGLYSQTGASIVTGNVISNLVCAAPNVGTGSSSSVLGIWTDNTSATIGNNISQNTVSALSNTNATAAVWVTGIYYGGSTTGTHVVQRNYLQSYNIISSSASATMNGIYIGAGATTYQNNFIRLGIDASGTPVTANIIINGINEITGTDNIYFNSVYIGGSGVSAGASNTYAFNSSVTVNVRKYRDNIFYNARSNGAGTGAHFAVKVSGTGPNPTGLTINNNVYYTSGTGGVFGYYNANVTTLADWKNPSFGPGQDAQSFFADPMFLNPNGTKTTADLHINPSVPTVIEGNGFLISPAILDDYDGQTRSGLTPVDIGADAGNFMGIDLVGPAITISPILSNTSNTGDRAISGSQITITDVSGVPTAGALKPRIYYKKNAGPSWFSQPGTLNGGSGTNGTWNFTIVAADMGGLTISDVVSYYVIAQDIAGNISSNPSAGLVATDVNTVTTPPTTPYTYIITDAPLSGDYTIGVLALNRALGKTITYERVTKSVMKEVFVADETRDNIKSEEVKESVSQYSGKGKMVMQEVEEVSFVPMENGKEYTGDLFVKRSENPELSGDLGVGIYGTITAAINDLSLRGVSGTVRFLLLDATYPAETYPITVNSFSNPGPYTVTLKPQTSVTSSISGSMSAGSLFSIRSSYFTIDGSNTVNGTTRDLTIENTSITTPTAVTINSSGTTPVTNAGIKNCNVINGVNTSSAIVLNDIAGTLAGYFNNITIQNNNVQKAYIGIFSNYILQAGNGSGVNISKNTITTSGANSVRFCGIYVQGADGANVGQNEIANFDGTSAEDDKGVWFATGTVNSIVEKNNIHDLVYTGTGGYGGHGVYVSTGVTGANITVKNNCIANLSGDGWNYTSIPTDNPIGIVVTGTQTGINLYFNSINLYGNTLNQTSAMSMGVYLGSGSVVDIRNNSIANSKGLFAATGYGSVGVYAATNNAQFANSNYNNYYVAATGSGVNYVGQIAAVFSTDLATWKSASGTNQDVNSQSGNPQYQSPTNLHVSLSTNSILNNNGVSIAGVTQDVDGDSRVHAWPPDIGCDEFTGAYVLYLTAASQYCPTGLYTVQLYDASLNLVGTVANVAITDNATNLSIVYNGINNLTGGYFSIAGINTLYSWSNLNTILPSDASSITYNMTTAQTQEFSGNMQFNNNGVWSLVAGDVNQDEIIDGTDLAAVENDIDCSSPGCFSGYPTDLNCDGDFVDAGDISIVENNQGFVVNYPPAANGVSPVKIFKSKEAKK